MRAKQIPSASCLVVKLGAGRASEAAAGLAKLGSVDSLGPDRVLLEASAASASAKDFWRRVLDEVKRVRWAAPVLLDEQGTSHVPSGNVAIRFRHAPPARELERFARSHGLRIEARNEFVPEQVSAAPLEARDCYLPDLVEQLAGAEEVLAAWAETLSEYRRH